jgi:NAD(P)-dependent dehydrogenase (short-subunit alcohol dehydrogenase family)
MAMKGQKTGGNIVCTASIAAIRADLTPLEYSASKAGVRSLVQSAGDRFAGSRVRVNGVLPGYVIWVRVDGVLPCDFTAICVAYSTAYYLL